MLKTKVFSALLFSFLLYSASFAGNRLVIDEASLGTFKKHKNFTSFSEVLKKTEKSREIARSNREINDHVGMSYREFQEKVKEKQIKQKHSEDAKRLRFIDEKIAIPVAPMDPILSFFGISEEDKITEKAKTKKRPVVKRTRSEKTESKSEKKNSASKTTTASRRETKKNVLTSLSSPILHFFGKKE